jgi:uncharacterized protein
MRTLFFGAASRKLYGAYHPAVGSAPPGARAQGVVLCYPGVEEYNVSHSAFRKLATLLSRAGLHVLRFDYSGTGDSAGETGASTPEDWVADIRAARAELSDLAGIQSVSLVGFRLGATLAAKAVAGGVPVGDLVLWDPVVVGREYVAELDFRDRQQNILLLHPTSRFAPPKNELLGYPFPWVLRSSLSALDLRGTRLASAGRILLMVTEERPAYTELRFSLASEREVSYDVVREDAEATNRGAREEVLLATKVLAAIRDRMVNPAS